MHLAKVFGIGATYMQLELRMCVATHIHMFINSTHNTHAVATVNWTVGGAICVIVCS